ncbi:hypothetical protein ACROYT_G023604 [Oculina patagonica]
MPRITSRQQHRSNTEAQNPKIYFQRNVAIPLLDHIIMCINEQFSPSATVAASLLGLVPSVLCSKNVNLEAAVNKYNDDLPSPEMFEMELMRWRGRYLAMEPELRPASPAVAIKDCDDDLFPNISILLKIACTIPVTSCECERSASTLRRLNNYMRASMGKERLSNLALLHIHYDTPVELDTKGVDPRVGSCNFQPPPRGECFELEGRDEKMTTAKALLCDWFMFMMSIPRTEPMTNTQKFTQWSSVLAYVVGGGSLLVWPQLWKILLQLDFLGRTEGYLRLIGLGVLVIGFIVIISARSNHQDPKHGAILGSVFSRVLYVNGILLMLVLRDMLPLSFALVFMGLDTLLSLITLVIWCRETQGASVGLFFQEVFTGILKFRSLTSGGSSAAIFVVGVFQLFFWLVFVIRPDIAQNILELDDFQGHSIGFLAAVFFTLSIHGWYHVINASAVNRSIVPAAVFYRLVFNVPALIILYLVDQIERNLCLTLLSFDLCTSLVILIFVTFSKKNVSTTEGDERKLLAPGEKEKN